MVIRRRVPFQSSKSYWIAKCGFVAAVSDLALIITTEPDVSFAQDGSTPHRIVESIREVLRMLPNSGLRGR